MDKTARITYSKKHYNTCRHKPRCLYYEDQLPDEDSAEIPEEIEIDINEPHAPPTLTENVHQPPVATVQEIWQAFHQPTPPTLREQLKRQLPTLTGRFGNANPLSTTPKRHTLNDIEAMDPKKKPKKESSSPPLCLSPPLPGFEDFEY